MSLSLLACTPPPRLVKTSVLSQPKRSVDLRCVHKIGGVYQEVALRRAGAIPVELGQLVVLTELHLDANKLTGEPCAQLLVRGV